MNVLFEGTVENVSTRRDKTIKVTLGTQEMAPKDAAELLSLQNRTCFVYVKDTGISQQEIDAVNETDPEMGGKTQSQRIRNVLFVIWQKNNHGFSKFDDFYQHKTEAIINHLKKQIDNDGY